MKESQARTLYGRVSEILKTVDAAHVAAGGDLQGCDNEIILAVGLPAEVKHGARFGMTWAAPRGWTPDTEPDFDGDLTYDDGSLWSDNGEEFGSATTDEAVNGLVENLFWLESGTCNLNAVGDIDGGDNWAVRGSVCGETFDFSAEMTDEQIASELSDCFAGK